MHKFNLQIIAWYTYSCIHKLYISYTGAKKAAIALTCKNYASVTEAI